MTVIRDSVINWQRGLSPVMLMESYESVSPKIGNLMNLVIIVFGMAAVFMAKTVNERFYKKEFKILAAAWVLTLPLYCVLIFIGKVNIALCVLALALGYFFITIGTATLNGWVIQFEPYKCEGAVAGMINSAAAVGTILESYLFCVIADKSGWISVIYLCAFLSFMSVILMLCASSVWKRFVLRNRESDKL